MPSEFAVIIDDSATGRKILERLTASLGGVVARAFAEVEGALSWCRECNPSLVVVGETPRGAAVADVIRSLQIATGGAAVPVLFVGSADDHEAVEGALEAGAADHLLAPIDHREFRLRARHLLRRREAPRHAEQQASDARADEPERKTEFLYNLSHEMRTPLNAIIGFSQVIAGEMLGPVGTPKYAGYARDILDSADRLLAIVNDILDMSRLESGSLELIEEIVDVPKTVAELVTEAEPTAAAASVRLSVSEDGFLPLLRADSRKLRQIVINLVTNAVKFSHAGGVVDVVLRNIDGAVAIAVQDRGIGMDPHEIELATSSFGQVATPWSRRHDGIGLGLPLATGLAELHGARLTIRSDKGVGTMVTVTFPRERSEPVPGNRAASAGLPWVPG